MMTLKFGRAVFAGLLLTSQLAFGPESSARQQGAPAPARAAKYPNLKTQAEAVVQAFDRRDFVTLVSLTHPKVVEMFGGPQRMVRVLTESVTFPTTTTIKEPQEVVRLGRRLYAVVPLTLRITVPEGVLVGDSFQLGVSEDGGKNWKFIAGEGAQNPEQLKALLPEAAGRLKFPEIKPPTLERSH